jgi:16S rRNA (guanine527-N7)-methyltransferase
MSVSAEAFRRAFDVSRETLARLETHVTLLRRWNPRINLVAGSTLADVWTRHVADSAQLFALRPPEARLWLDLGSGAGFPGLVIAALAAEAAPDITVRLVESDQRKAAFLATVAREARLAAEVVAERWQRLAPQGADVVSARALAPLGELLAALEKHRRPGGLGLFPKGGTVHKEIAEASVRWRFEHKLTPSRTEPRAAILEIGAIERV